MSVSTFVAPNSATQTAAAYPGVLDAATSVFTRISDNFAPHAQSTPNMSIALDPGHVLNGTTLTEVATQSTTTITAPTTNPRVDRVVVSSTTGVLQYVIGTEAASPVPPAIPAGTLPIAQVALQTTTTAITNTQITDERSLINSAAASSGGNLLNVRSFTSSGTYTPTSGTNKVIVEVQGGGGSGGGTATTTGSNPAASSGGGAGAYAKALITSGFSGVTVTVGAGGASPTAGANNGNDGGTSSFGSLVSAPGGGHGLGGPADPTLVIVGGSATSAAPTGANIVGAPGQGGGYGLILSTGSVVGGTGASSYFGAGGVGGGAAVGAAAISPGAGGGGSSSITGGSAARSGGAGAAGIVIVYEYS